MRSRRQHDQRCQPEPSQQRASEEAVAGACVARHFAGLIRGPVERFELPNLRALNFLLHGALDGGGTISLKTDAQGKVFSTALLRLRIRAPR